jgi:hypothetical protein
MQPANSDKVLAAKELRGENAQKPRKVRANLQTLHRVQDGLAAI